ncbi:hypothetical protein [Nocardioides sp. URHA0020]|uniref:hypothetical protein n=1 Tax=Nocardioides sp. URHA0020 TaxID=1380392 RepID=UPI000491E47F|nr:hypothetical protein [Nocardioides sp. URHA0020]
MSGIRTSTSFRALAGVVTAGLVATSVGLVAAPVVADPAPAATSISIRALKPAIAPGRTDTIVGSLHVRGGSAAGRPVALEARAKGESAFTPVGTATAGEKGGVRLTVKPEVTTRYRWHYAGAPDARPRVSGVALVKVRTPQHPAKRLGTTLSVRAVHPSVAPGGRTVVRGILRSGRTALRGRQVVLLARTSAQQAWQFRRVQRTARDGHVRFTVRPSTRTAFRLSFAGTTTFRPAKSAVVRVGVRKGAPSSLSIRGRDVAQGFAVSGQLRAARHAVRNAPVTLQTLDAGTSAWADTATKRTGRHGGVRFVRPSAPGASYRLVYAGGRFASSTSATLTD